MIYLFRHTHAGTRRDWDGPDRERPLTERGRHESAVIAERWAGSGITAILSSPYLRCLESVEAFSRATGLQIEATPSLEEGADPELAYSELTGAREGALLCTHGDIVAALIGRASAEGAGLEDGPAWEKGSIWLLERGPGGRVRAGRYHPPPVTAL
ncbi:MAG: histidine phosphatase family protein [Actinobacteria bacterium]|nr:histidine phosphatase family protein [Actinomycetota bacterium]